VDRASHLELDAIAPDRQNLMRQDHPNESVTMNPVRLILLVVLLPMLSFAEVTLEEARKNGMGETLQTYIEHNSIIVDICVYEQSWIPPSAGLTKGRLVQRAVVTNVHRGTLRVGDKIEYTHFIEDAPRFLGPFTSTVPGKLRTFFYDPEEPEQVVDGLLKIEGDGHWGFDRVGDAGSGGSAFAALFELELKTHPKLKSESQQDAGAGRAKPGR
jgi:hypothetical protein